MEIARTDAAQAIEQLQEGSTVSHLYGGKSQTHSAASRHVPHYTFDPDLFVMD